MFQKYALPILICVALILTGCAPKGDQPIQSLSGKMVTLISYFKDAQAAKLTLTINQGGSNESFQVDYFAYIPIQRVNGVDILGNPYPNFGLEPPYFFYGAFANAGKAYNGNFPDGFKGNTWVRVDPDGYVTFFVTQPFSLTAADKKILALSSDYQARRNAKAKLIGATTGPVDQGSLNLLNHLINPYAQIPGAQCENMESNFKEWGMESDLQEWEAYCGPVAYALFGGLSDMPNWSNWQEQVSLMTTPISNGNLDGVDLGSIDIMSFANAQLPDTYDTKGDLPICSGDTLKVASHTFPVKKIGQWQADGNFLFDSGIAIGDQLFLPYGGWLIVTPQGVGAGIDTYSVYRVCSN